MPVDFCVRMHIFHIHKANVFTRIERPEQTET